MNGAKTHQAASPALKKLSYFISDRNILEHQRYLRL